MVSITQQIDLSVPVGRMVASVMFGLAEIELEYRRERQQAGNAVANNRGVYRGRQKGATKSKPTRGPGALADGGTVRQLAAGSIAENTRRAYAGALRRLDGGLGGALRDPLLAAYLGRLCDAGEATARVLDGFRRPGRTRAADRPTGSDGNRSMRPPRWPPTAAPP